jgi:hypothetical protein
MNVLTTTWRQLVRRRLWPVALLLLAALAAVPVLLTREPEPVVPGPAPAQAATTDEALAEPVVAKISSEDHSRRRRVLGVRKNPFLPAPVKKPKKTTKATTKSTGGTTVTGGSSAPKPITTPVTSPSPVLPTLPVAPAPPKKTYAKGSLIVRFGDATTVLKRMNVKKLAPLPDDETPLLVYMGLTKNGKKAIFLVDESLDPTGDGTCKPHPASCETIELAKGETEFFDEVDAESGDVVKQYELDLVDIK